MSMMKRMLDEYKKEMLDKGEFTEDLDEVGLVERFFAEMEIKFIEDERSC